MNKGCEIFVEMSKVFHNNKLLYLFITRNITKVSFKILF